MIQKLGIFRNIFLFYYIATNLGVKCQRQQPFSNTVSKSINLSDLKSDYNSFLTLLSPILIERVSGTPGNEKVRNYIKSKMENYGWSVQLDNFSDQTPFGIKNFANIIATYPIGQNFKNTQTYQAQDFLIKNRVVFACHYDSKYFSNFKFLAATDSAVPCAMLLDLAKFLNEKTNKNQFKNLYRHIQFIFFDGEEAFKDWTSTDSIYGSRHYAKLLKTTYNKRSFDSIDLFVLLDLLGAKSSKFPNYFPYDSTSNNAYKVLNQIEKKLINEKLMNIGTSYYFTDLQGQGQYYQVEDDHKPFLLEGVPILHLIPSPFPTQWHNQNDNFENLNEKNIQDLRLIMKYFLMQILNQTEKRTRDEDEF